MAFLGNMIRRLLKKVIYYVKYILLKNKVELKGSHYNVGPHSSVVLKDGSVFSDIQLGDYVDLYGCLYSQSGGKIIIGDHCRIGLNATIRSVESVVLGNRVIISENVKIVDNNSHPIIPLFNWYRAQMPPSSSLHLWKFSQHKPVVIGDNVWIGESARICKGVSLGSNSIIGANAVVTKDIPDNCVAVGNPAKIVKTDIDKLEIPTTCVEFNELLKKYGNPFQ